jgi:hypothetical protein
MFINFEEISQVVLHRLIGQIKHIYLKYFAYKEEEIR